MSTKVWEVHYQYSQQSTRINLATIPLAIEGVNDPFSVIPPQNHLIPPKVSKFAKLKVTNNNQIRINNVGVVVMKANNRPEQLRLSVSSLDTLFDRTNPPAPKTTIDLNPNDEEYFDVVIECNGRTCPKGKLLIPHVDNGQRLVMTPVYEEVEKLEDFTVRASGDGVIATIKKFGIRIHDDGYLILESKKD